MNETMKRSDLRNIIKEEYIKILSEAFGDPIASKLQKLGGLDQRYKSFWRATANTYKIAWDKLPKGSFRKINSANEAKKGMTFYVITGDKPNPFGTSGYAYDNILRKGVLAVTVDSKVQYFQPVRSSQGDTIGPKGTGFTTRDSSQAIGKGMRGTLQFKKLVELADVMYNFDLEAFRGGTTALKAKRAELKSGKDLFTNPKAWKKANLDRYKAMLADKVGSRDQVDKMVAQIVKIANEAVTKALALPRMGQYNELVADLNGKDVPINAISREMNNGLDYYARYIRAENSNANFIKKYPEYGEGGSKFGSRDAFYQGDMRENALEIKRILDSLKSGRIR
jgi:hypothetical protein